MRIFDRVRFLEIALLDPHVAAVHPHQSHRADPVRIAVGIDRSLGRLAIPPLSILGPDLLGQRHHAIQGQLYAASRGSPGVGGRQATAGLRAPSARPLQRDGRRRRGDHQIRLRQLEFDLLHMLVDSALIAVLAVDEHADADALNYPGQLASVARPHEAGNLRRRRSSSTLARAVSKSRSFSAARDSMRTRSSSRSDYGDASTVRSRELARTFVDSRPRSLATLRSCPQIVV